MCQYANVPMGCVMKKDVPYGGDWILYFFYSFILPFFISSFSHWHIGTLTHWQIINIGKLFNRHLIHNFFSGQILFCTFAQSFSKLTLIKKNLIWEVFSEQSHKGPV